ncbi:MAG: NAD(P)-dependent oxidoreductase [Acidimicrobiia bacterium]
MTPEPGLPSERPVLVTGALGCIGAWTVRELMAAGVPVVAFDSGDDDRRLRQVTPPDLIDRVRVVNGDVADLISLLGVIESQNVGRIVHLAALQVPACRSDPPRGAVVNVVGTVNVFEAARRAGLESVVYTSSAAVFDQPGARVEVDTRPEPRTHYGVYKLANEGTARAYWYEFDVPSIGIRPMTVYGPGRDRGLTSSPTKALLAATLGCSYEIAFGGTTLLHYARDVGRALVSAAQVDVTGAHVANLNGTTSTIADFVATTREVAGASAGRISVSHRPLPFPDDADTTGLDIVGSTPITPLEDGIAETLEFFRALDRDGKLHPADHGLVVENGVARDAEVL